MEHSGAPAGGLSYIWNSPGHGGRIVPYTEQSGAPGRGDCSTYGTVWPSGKGDCPIYGTVRLLGPSGIVPYMKQSGHPARSERFAEKGRFPCETPWAFGGGMDCFAGETPRPWASDGRGYATPPIPPWPFPQVARSLFPGASGRSGASGFRAVAGFSPGFPTEFLVAKKSLPFLGAKKFGVDGFLPDAGNPCGNPFRV
jgi:hypothetical protein